MIHFLFGQEDTRVRLEETAQVKGKSQ